MLNFILVILLIAILFPAFGVGVVVGVGLVWFLKILLVVLLIVLIMNIASGRNRFW